MENKIKTGIRLKVNEEQSRQVQEICFASGLEWFSGAKNIIHTDAPYLVITEYITCRMEGQQDVCLPTNFKDIDADLFIRTAGTCIEPKVEEDKKYLIYVQGKGQPKVRHTLENAETEAKRLASKEIGKEVHIVEVIKTYKSKVIIEEI